MNARKTVFVIPGFKQKPTNRPYKEIAKILKKEGYFPIIVSIPWRQTTVSENATFFLKKYKKIRRKKKYILGFSFGAMIAFLAATKIRVSGLILCSLSPYFEEDMHGRNKSLIVKNRTLFEDCSTLRSRDLAKKLKTKQILMLYGAKEAKSLIKRVFETFDHISSPRKYLIAVLKAEHNIGDKRYLKKIHQITKELR